MLELLKKEINGFLNSLIAYVVVIVFLLTLSLFLWVFPDEGFNILNNGYANIDPLFILTPWVYMFLIPAICMRMFSEETKSGTIELLLTKPLSEFKVVFAKFLSGVIIVIFSLIPTIIYYISVDSLSVPPGNVDTGSIWGSYFGLVFLGAGFVSIGLFASSLTDNQVIAFIIALFFCFFCYAGFDSVGSFLGSGFLSNLMFELGINTHYNSISRGVIDSRDLIYFLSLITFFIVLTITRLESRKW
ncbi:MAG: gliding motility-associated ABC transporter permease subunit GldF [Bacteroidia bacterium]|nr:gliding motility-associated ABC transporter permease subunit GldF [Bacteroidia bacterium]